MRELVFSDNGITLADPYTAGGEVLMGTLRIERENAVGAEHERLSQEIERLTRARMSGLDGEGLRQDTAVRERDSKLVRTQKDGAKPAAGKPRARSKAQIERP